MSGVVNPDVSFNSPHGINGSRVCITPTAGSFSSEVVTNGSSHQVRPGRLAPPSPTLLRGSEGRSAEHREVRVETIRGGGDADASGEPPPPVATTAQGATAARGVCAVAARAVPAAGAIGGSSVRFGGGYRPQPGDMVDQKVAEFLNRPDSGDCKALFCRLGEGAHLYGMHRTRFRVAQCAPGADELEAFADGTWTPIP